MSTKNNNTRGHSSQYETSDFYAGLGIPVFPLFGKQPPLGFTGGFYNATTDPAKREKWFDTLYPGSNIGMPTGDPSGILVLDVDPDHGGLESLARLVSEHGELPETVTVITGGGGTHYWFENDPVQPLRNSAGVIASGLDIRGTGGYVVAPTSIHPTTGQPYRFEPGKGVGEIRLAPMPEWLRDLVKESHQKVRGGNAGEPIKDGARNAALMSFAGTMRARGMTENEIAASLHEINRTRCETPLPEDEVEKIAENACKYEPNSPLIAAEHSDTGNGERFIYQNQDSLRYWAPSDRWFKWNGSHYEHANAGEEVEAAKATIIATKAAALNIPDQNRQKALLRWAGKMQSASQINNMIKLAKSDPRLTIRVELMDANPMLLSVANGTLDLASVTLLPHRRTDNITLHAPVLYDPAATCPKWETFLNEIFQGDADLIDYVQRAVGYSITGTGQEQKLFLMFGIGANGKSTFLGVLRSLFGTYSEIIGIDAFSADKADDKNHQFADLRGVRLVIARESELDKRLAEGAVKWITGEDEIKCRF